MLVNWLAVETPAYFENIFSVPHSVPHDRLLFYGVNGQFIVSLARVTAASDENGQGIRDMTIIRPPRRLSPLKRPNGPGTATTR